MTNKEGFLIQVANDIDETDDQELLLVKGRLDLRKAYDTVLQAEVSADLAARSGGSEPYRYECAHCGEEVRLAAVGSLRMVPHFRHRSGNNDVECENYLGQYGTIISTDARSRKSKNERAEFYFDSNTKMFYLGLRFSEDEIAAYEARETLFELRASTREPAFVALRINSRNFSADIANMIPLNTFSHNYYLSNTLNGLKREHRVIKRGRSTPTFFKIQSGDSDFKARLVRSDILYTDVPYLAVYLEHSVDDRLPSEIAVDRRFMFETMGRRFLGKTLTITTKSVRTDSLLRSWGYQLEASETLTLLWPPSAMENDTTLVDGSCAYLYSTFELQAHGNINVRPEDITQVSDRVSKVMITARTKVYRKNAELVIAKRHQVLDGYESLEIAKEVASDYIVPDDEAHFLFNRSGVTPVTKGMRIWLTPDSRIACYKWGYLDGCIVPEKQDTMTGERLLRDILAHYKRLEAFVVGDFASLELSQTARQYVEGCAASGQINTAAKRFIKDGRI